MKIPSKIKIGAVVWKVSIEKLEDSKCGSTNVKKLLIKIDSEQDKRAQELTFIHELLHAINTEVNDEVVNEYMALSLYQIIQENPGIFTK